MIDHTGEAVIPAALLFPIGHELVQRRQDPHVAVRHRRLHGFSRRAKTSCGTRVHICGNHALVSIFVQDSIDAPHRCCCMGICGYGHDTETRRPHGTLNLIQRGTSPDPPSRPVTFVISAT